jgi:hypothetical protein
MVNHIQELQLPLIAYNHNSIEIILQWILLLVTFSFPKQSCGGSINHI